MSKLVLRTQWSDSLESKLIENGIFKPRMITEIKVGHFFADESFIIRPVNS